MTKYERYHIPGIGGGGYRSDVAPHLLTDIEAAEGSENLNLETPGSLRKRKGTSKFNTAATAGYAECVGLAHYRDDAGTSNIFRVLVQDAGGGAVKLEYCNDVYQQSSWTTADISGVTWTTTADKYQDFAVFQGELYVATQLDKLIIVGKANPTAAGDVTQPGTSPSVVSGVEVWFDRVWLYRHPAAADGGRVIYWSSFQDGSTYDITNSVQHIPTQSHITGMERLGDKLLVFTENEVFKLSGGDDPVGSLYLEPLTIDGGCLGPRSIIEANGVVYWYSPSGFMATDGNIIRKISDKIDPDVAQFDADEELRINGVFDRARNQVVWFVPFGNVSNNNRAYVYDVGQKLWCPPYTNQAFTVSLGTFRHVLSNAQPAIVVAGEDSYVRRWGHASDLDDDGTEVLGKVYTGAISLGDESMNKRIRQVNWSYGETGTANKLVYLQLFAGYAIGTASAEVISATHALGSETVPHWKWLKSSFGTVPSGEWFRICIGDKTGFTCSFITGAVTLLYVPRGYRR